MKPQYESTGWVLEESDAATEDKGVLTALPPSAEKRTYQIVWSIVIALFLAHIGAVYGGYLFFTRAKWFTIFFTVVLYVTSIFGITAGVHRLWTHKAYKARLPLRLLLVFLNTVAFQGPILTWARDHRIHHKYSETDADPHNATRGFFFSHVGWLLVKKHPEVLIKGRMIDMSDLYADPMLRFQKQFYGILMPICCFILPSLLPTLWDESVWNAFFVCVTFRYITGFNGTALVNSAAHMWGNRPYDQNINPTEVRFVSAVVHGEGFHNYHHTFPWDYKAAELGYSLNLTTMFIDAMARIGWAYDLKTVSPDLIEKRVKRTGDGSHHVWGWDDATQWQKAVATIVSPDKSQ